MLYETASQYIQSGRALLPFLPYAVISDRGAWDSLDPEWRDKTVALGESFLHFSWPYLSATDFLDFSRTGNRVRFEDRFFAKRHALDALVLAECVENKGRFLDDIINGIFSICDENAWNLPPHNSYRRDAPQLPLPDLAIRCWICSPVRPAPCWRQRYICFRRSWTVFRPISPGGSAMSCAAAFSPRT